jgi:hypothetical protein
VPLKVSELDFRRQLVGTKPPGLAIIFGWEHVGFRPAQTAHGWRTPVTGSLGLGWPDLVLVRARDRRLIFAELKADDGKLSPDQEHVLEVLRPLENEFGPRIDVCVWYPRDLGAIAEILR